MLTTHNPTKIAALNDAARKSFSGCPVYMTPGVQALYQTQGIAARVQAYDDFTERVESRWCALFHYWSMFHHPALRTGHASFPASGSPWAG